MGVPDDVKQLIDGSGNAFHARVARWFTSKGWEVTVSPYFLDKTQGKAREIDLIVEKAYPVNDFGREIGYVAVRLFVECKFISGLSAFWLAQKDKRAAEGLVLSCSAFTKNNSHKEKHHYLSHSEKVAKLFASGGKSPENEPIYKALNQVLNATVSMRSESFDFPRYRRANLPMKAKLEFPVVVCNSFDRFFATSFEEDTEPTQVEENFQLEVTYAFPVGGSQRQEYFLIDFVEFAQLDNFLRLVSVDAESAVYLSIS
jgi:hypothetical protein